MLLLACALQAAVWPVASPVDFLAAESIAQPGDLIEFQPGDYDFAYPLPGFVIDVGVTVTVAGGGRATIRSATPPFVSAPNPGEVLSIEGFDFESLYLFPLDPGGGLSVGPGSGSVWLVDCTTAAGGVAERPGLRVTDANLVVRGGTYQGAILGLPAEPQPGQPGQPGLLAEGSTIMAQGAAFSGTDGRNADAYQSPTVASPSTVGGAGVELSDCTAGFFDCLLQGGDGGDGYFYDTGGSGYVCRPASGGGDSITFEGGASVVSINGGSLSFGQGGADVPSCQSVPSPDGLFYGGSGLDAALVKYLVYDFLLDAPSAVAPNTIADITVTTPPFVVPRMLALSGDVFPGLLNTFGQTSFLGPAMNLIPLPQALTPAQLQVLVPALPPSAPFVTVYLQAIDLLNGSIQFSAPAATTIR